MTTAPLRTAANYTSTSLNEAVKLRLGEQGFAAAAPQTIPQLFRECCKKYEHLPALAFYDEDSFNFNLSQSSDALAWRVITYAEYALQVEEAALILLSVGLKPRSTLAILSSNCPEWFYAELGALRIGAVVAGIYPSNSPEAVYHVLKTSSATVCIVEDDQQMAKVRAIKSRLPLLRAVLQLHGPYGQLFNKEPDVYRWNEFTGTQFSNALKCELYRKEYDVYPNDCALLVFTSGTVGLPKAVMLSHDSLVHQTKLYTANLKDLSEGADTFISYLPLSHIAAQVVDILQCMHFGNCIYFADRNALKGTLSKTIQEVRPTYFLGVPRVFGKIQEQINSILNSSTITTRLYVNTCRAIVEDYNIKAIEGRWKILQTLSGSYYLALPVVEKFKVALGLDRCKGFVAGGAPITDELKRFFLGFNIRIIDAYGMSETSGLIAMDCNCKKLNMIGKPMEGVELKIQELDNQGFGELCIRSRLNFMGYLNDIENTKKTINEEGWIQTGDVGFIDKDGNFMVTGRLKELIITEGGENIPYPLIEDAIKKEMPFISNAMLIGDRRKYLTVLLTLKTNVDSDTGLPLDTLQSQVVDWLQSLGLEYKCLSDVLHISSNVNRLNNERKVFPKLDVAVRREIEKCLKQVNAKAISNAQKVQKFTVLPHEFSIATGELGPTLKLRRVIILQKYAHLIDEMYNDQQVTPKMAEVLTAIDLTRSTLKVATSYTSTSLHDAVKLRIGEQGLAATKPQTIPQFFKECCQNYPQQPALVYEETSKTTGISEKTNTASEAAESEATWRTVTYAEYAQKVQQAALILIHVGLQPRSTIGILAFNCPEWFYAELGAYCAGGVVAGIYPSSSAEAVYHVLDTSDATVCVVDDAKQMAKVREVKSRLPRLRAVLQLHGPYDDFVGNEDGYYSWEDLMRLEFDNDLREELEYRERNIYANECAMLIYTSGTVGMPKGVMLSHDSIVFNGKTIVNSLINVQKGAEVFVTYLPLNHVAGQVFDLFMNIAAAGCIYFADRNALKGTLCKTLLKANPTLLFGVPRIYEKIQEKFIAVQADSSTLGKYIMDTSRDTVLRYHLDVMEGKSPSTIKYWLASRVTRQIRIALGLDNCKTLFIGGAPVSVELKHFFLSLDMPLLDVYGMSENSGCITIPTKDTRNLQSAGKPLEGVEVKIFNPNAEGHGEICVRGRTPFMGYVNDVEKTKETMRDDGWLQSGDIGYFDTEGNLIVSGRIKEIIITAGGENIPPTRIEELIKYDLNGIANAMLVGDQRKFLTVLLTIKTEIDTITGLPLDDLRDEAISWLQSLGLDYTKLSQVLSIPADIKDLDASNIEVNAHPKVIKSIEECIARVNAKAISHAQKVQKFALLPHDFSVPTGELGQTLKLRRNIILQKYAHLIEQMYKL